MTAKSVWYRASFTDSGFSAISLAAFRSLFMPPSRRSAASENSPRGTTYSISDLAREFALTTRAIRFYEDCGLVTPGRSGRARIYGERERVRIKLILRGKRLGLALAEIRELLDLYEVAHNEHAQLSKFLTLLAERRARLLQQKEDIDAVLAEIGGIERDCRRRLKQEEGEGRGSGHKTPARTPGVRRLRGTVED